MLSVIVPLFNEEESLPLFYEAVTKELSRITKQYEIIFVDDGSTDRSLDILKEFSKKDKNVNVFSFRKNLGKAEALNLGFQKAQGDYVVTLDADLEDNPSEVQSLLNKLNEGYDLVTGWRKNRKHAKFMIIPSRIFNFLTSSLWGLKLHDYNCGLKVYRKEVIKNINIYGGLHRFIPLLAFKQGFKVCEMPVSHENRKYGKSKYGFSKVWKDMPDMFTMLFITKYGKRPLHFFSLIGSLLILIGVSFISYLTFIHYFYNEAVGRRPLLFMGMLFVISGIQIFFTGFLADLILHISRNSNNGNDNESILKYSSEK